MKKHECIIGFYYGYDNSSLFTLEDLKDHIESKKQYNEWHKEKFNSFAYDTIYELKDYFDKRKSTDVEMFTYCPICGEKIEYKGE